MSEPDPAALFGEIYAVNGWLGGSGVGSFPEATAVYRQVVQRAVDAGDVRSVVDAGCGDWQIARLLDWSGVTYLGVDVVPELIERHRAAHGNANVRFECLDMTKAPLPKADLLVCKDVLQHLPNSWVSAFLAHTAGRYRYLLITNDVVGPGCPPEGLNSDIGLGLWRTLDLARPPFGLKADWTVEYDVDGGWRKRMQLSVRPSYRPVARLRRDSVFRRLAELPPR